MDTDSAHTNLLSARQVACTREQAFTELVQRVHSCHLCPRMEGRARVLSRTNGSLQSNVLFVAEAPGRLGADRSGIPLFGDQAGRNFTALLQAAGLDRATIFITNAVLCNPRDTHQNNATPTVRELHNCAPHLQATIDIIQPRYVVTLGQVALKALSSIAPHDIVLARDVACPFPWYGRYLIPLYHPSARACIRRPFSLQIEDYRHLKEVLVEIERLPVDRP